MRTSTLQAAGLATLLALGACGDGSTGPAADESILDDDIALLAADAVQEDLLAMSTTFPAVGLDVSASSVLQEYSVSRTVQFFDAQGNEQPAYDALTTDSIHTLLTVAGTVSRDGFEWSMERSRDMSVTGLAGEETERTWNGTGSDDRSRARVVDPDQTRTYDLTGTLLVENVVRGVPRIEHPWPLSGTITRNLTIEIVNGPDGDETITRTVIVTFNGTQYVTMTVNGEEYEVDLAALGREKVHRRHAGGEG